VSSSFICALLAAALSCALCLACTGQPGTPPGPTPAPSAASDAPGLGGRPAATGDPAATATAAAGPAREGGADPVVWSDEVCSALASWSSELSAEAATATSALEAAETVEEAATGLEDLLAAATASTDELLTALDDAGDPAVGSGAEIGGEVRRAAEDARAAIERLSGLLEDPAGDPDDFAAQAQEVVDGYAAATAAVGQRIDEASDRYPAPELDAAGALAASCAAPSASPSG